MNVSVVLWLALPFGICKVTCVMVERSGVMFGVSIVTHPFACDFLNIQHFRKVNKYIVTVCTCGVTPVLLVCISVLSRLSLCF